MAQSSHENQLNLTIKKDIKVPNFSLGGHPASVTLEHDGTEPFFNAKVYPNGCDANHEGHVSVMVQRCWFYPRFIPGVVYGSLGWTISVIDVEGREKFHAYFGEEDFLSLAWADDLFDDHEFGVERLVKRSQLLDSPDEYLPGDVLTVRCEAFYVCHTGSAALTTTGLEINSFLVKGFQTGADVQSGHQSEGQSQFENVRSNGIESHWRKSLRMMEESIDELNGAFELYAKFQMLKDITDQNPKGGGEASNSQQDRDFRQDIGMASAVFMSLREDAMRGSRSLDSVEEGSSDTIWYDEPDGIVKITHQVVRILALHKHLQLHFENCRKWYKEAEEKMRIDRDSSTGIPTRHYTLEDETRELFFLYNDVRDSFRREKGTEQDYLLLRVSRFVAIFLNMLRLMALRLYWPLCVLQTPPPSTSSDTKALDIDTEPSVIVQNKDAVSKVSTIEETPLLSTIPETEKVDEEPSETDQNNTAVHKMITNQAELDIKFPGVPDSGDTTDDKWYFTIETADGQQLDVPFQAGRTTLGSMIRAASPVFDRMLETPMLEREQRRVKLEDVDFSTLSHFTTYVETGEVTTETLDDCRLLYMMAHKYQVSNLLLDCGKRICELMSHLTAEEVGEFSKFFEDDNLMSKVEAYCFRPRATMAVMGLQDLNVSPLSPDSTWSQTIAQVPVVEKATEAIVPKQEYDFYN